MKRVILGLLIILAGIAVSPAQSRRKVLDYFMLLPQQYFGIESCDTDRYRNCDRFKREYLKMFLQVNDARRGYLQSGGDGSQESLKMKVFRRANGTEVIAMNVTGEWGFKYFFLEYRNGRWKNVSRIVVPKYRRSNVYEISRRSKALKVSARSNFDPAIDQGDDGPRLYDLIWNGNRFVKKKKRAR